MSGPLHGIRVIVLSALGPVPFCGQLLSDLGADVVRIDRLTSSWVTALTEDPGTLGARGCRSVAVDLKHPDGVGVLLSLVESADVLIEGYRPGVTERLGAGPKECLAVNPRLVYGRCSGWGRTGPLANRAGHDLNYLAVAGIVSMLGTPKDPPPPTLGLIGDHGGGGMLLTVGVLAALVERSISARGQVVDTSILDGALALSTPYHEIKAAGGRTDERWTHIADGSAPFYNTYETADGRYVAVGAVEPQFYEQLVALLGLANENLPDQADRASWAAIKERFAERFRQRTRDEWCALAEGVDACLSPVLTLSEVPGHPHNVARNSFVAIDGMMQPAPVPIFDRTSLDVPGPSPARGENTAAVLSEWGFSEARVAKLLDSGVIAGNSK